MVMLAARRFDKAKEQSRRTLELDPTYAPAFWDLTEALAATGQPQEAVAIAHEASQFAKGDVSALGNLGQAYARAGQRAEAIKVLDQLKERRAEGYVPAMLLGLVELSLGEHDQALRWLEQAYEDRDGLLPCINCWVWFDPHRSDPRFQALLKKMNFPSAPRTE